MKQALCDYGIKLGSVPLLCDNEITVKIANNPVQHSRTSILKSVITFLGIMWPMETFSLEICDPKINWQISSPNL